MKGAVKKWLMDLADLCNGEQGAALRGMAEKMKAGPTARVDLLLLGYLATWVGEAMVSEVLGAPGAPFPAKLVYLGREEGLVKVAIRAADGTQLLVSLTSHEVPQLPRHLADSLRLAHNGSRLYFSRDMYVVTVPVGVEEASQ